MISNMFKLKDKVKVLVNRSEQLSPTKWENLFDGYVVGMTSHFVQIFSPTEQHGSFPQKELAEFYPVMSKRCKVLLF